MAKKAKLRPDAQRSAKDVMEENERKRRREDEEGEDVSDLEAPDKEKPLEGLKAPKKKAQKQKAEQDVHSQLSEKQSSQPQPSKKTKEQRAKEKELKGKARLARKEEKRQLKKAKQQAAAGTDTASTEPVKKAPQAQLKVVQKGTSTGTLDNNEDLEQENDFEEDEPIVLNNDMEAVDVAGLVPDIQADAQSSASVSPAPGSTFSHTSPQPTSSNSSVVPLHPDEGTAKSAAAISSALSPTENSAQPTPDRVTSKKPTQLSAAEREANRLKLAARIEEMRKARNADGLNGKPAKNRAELIEARRLKQEKRKQHKKELRAEQKEAEKNQEVEAELAKLRGSPSMGSDLFSGGSSPPNNFSFGRVAFKDGQRVNSSLSGLVDIKKKSNPDARAALVAAEKKKARLMSYDEEKRADIEQKDVWLNASKKVHGERVRDDTNLLKKTLKRKDKMKNKSEREWNERIEGVKKGQAFQQKKREENLAKRKEEKGSKGKGKGAKKGGLKKKKSRPGFEGSFRGRA
jgi:hypothetical protein